MAGTGSGDGTASATVSLDSAPGTAEAPTVDGSVAVDSEVDKVAGSSDSGSVWGASNGFHAVSAGGKLRFS